MSNYVEADHVRDAGGKYAAKVTSETDSCVLDQPHVPPARVSALVAAQESYDQETLDDLDEDIRTHYPDAASARMSCDSESGWHVDEVRDADGTVLSGFNCYSPHTEGLELVSTPWSNTAADPWWEQSKSFRYESHDYALSIERSIPPVDLRELPEPSGWDPDATYPDAPF